MNVVILGEGAWGNAVASLFRQNKSTVHFWKKGEKIPSGSIVFSAIPTQALREVLSQLSESRNLVFINGAKGIEQDTHFLPYQVTREKLPDCEYLTLVGPSFASEVIQKMPTLVNLGYRNEEVAEKVKSLLQTDYFRIKLTNSVRSLELSAAFKNIYAIACGVAEGLGYGINTRVKLMILALIELENLRKQLDFKIDDKALPATIGDLVLTCSSSESRNFHFGKLLVVENCEESLRKVGATVEGYFTVKSVPFLQEKVKVSLPLAQFVYDITHAKQPLNIRQVFENFVKNS